MPDRLALPALALFAAGLIALAFVWPQGQGERSPAPFGRRLAALPAPTPAAAVAAAKAAAPERLRGPEPAGPRP